LLLAGCGDEASAPAPAATSVSAETETVPSVSSETQTSSATVALAPLPPDLVGTWKTSKWLDQSGSQQIVRTYVFSPDGHYDYTVAMCRSTDCTFVSQGSGTAQAVDGTLTLVAESGSTDGSGEWPYVVGRDPDVGDIQLHLRLIDGQVDIFYFGE
jgi:hypothetical protein